MIAIIDYNAGNTRSVKNALERLGYEAKVTSDADMISKADKVIFPDGIERQRNYLSALQR